MKSALTFASILVLFLFQVSSARAELGLQLTGALARNSNPPALSSEDSNTTVTGTFAEDQGYGLGFTFGSLASNTRFETGFLFFQRELSITTDNGFVVEDQSLTIQTLMIPFQFRTKLGRFLSISYGGYYDYSMTVGYLSDLGATVGGRVTVPLKGNLNFFAEGRYNYGIYEFDGISTRQTLILAGITWR